MLHELISQRYLKLKRNHLKPMLHELKSQRGWGMALLGVEEHKAQGKQF